MKKKNDMYTAREWAIYNRVVKRLSNESPRLEKTLTKSAMAYWKSNRAAYCYKAKASMGQQVGVSDLVGVAHGRFVAIELKVGRNEPSKTQLHFLSKVLEAGGVARVCWNMAEVKDTLAEAMMCSEIVPTGQP